jgi:CheY-like chemotaxis protein
MRAALTHALTRRSRATSGGIGNRVKRVPRSPAFRRAATIASATIVHRSRTPHRQRASLTHPVAHRRRERQQVSPWQRVCAALVLASSWLTAGSAQSRASCETPNRDESNVTTFLKTWLAHVMAAPTAAPAESELGILIVDDEVSACSYAEHVLRRAGYQPVTASSGPEAVQKAGAMARLDVLVTNLMMPGMNGDELAGALRRRDVNLKVLYVAGFSDRLFAEKIALRDGGAFLERPYSMAGLEQALALLAYGRLDRPARETAASATAPALWM